MQCVAHSVKFSLFDAWIRDTARVLHVSINVAVRTLKASRCGV
ncbi:IS1-like element transposase [Yersinia similis]